jgi:membrane protease YdiL (CAAX protease family)
VTLLKTNKLVVALLLIVYFAWWAYAIYFLYWKEYDSDSGFSAYYATMGIMTITAIILLAYAGIFLLEAKKNEESRKLFLFATRLLFLPLAGIAVVEVLRLSYSLLQTQ